MGPLYRGAFSHNIFPSVSFFPRLFFFSKKKGSYALFKGWLLLSQPSHCLKFKTSFDTLSQYLGTLTAGSVVFVSDTKLTPRTLTPAQTLTDSEFDNVGRSFPR